MPATDHYWRPLNTMHKVFAFSAIVLLASTILMMAKDHRDEWREYQSEADKLQAAKLQQKLDALTGEDYQAKLDDLEKRRKAAEQELAAEADKIAPLEEQITELQGQVDLLARQMKFKGAERDVARADYDIGVRDEMPEDVLARLKAEFDRKQAEYDELGLQLDRKKAELADAKGRLAAVTARRDELDEELKKLQADVVLVVKALDDIAPKSRFRRFKRWLMLQPIVDGFNSPHHINQEWLPDLPITYGMATTARFDRCRTCHLNIADFGAGNVPNYPQGKQTDLAANVFAQPFSSHPNPDVYVSSTSPHPMPSFGCTICHDGDGSGTSFQNAEHTPNHPAEAELWAAEHHWHSNHFWEYPMQPSRFIESTCLKCHHSVTELGVNDQFGATAPKVFEGYELVKTYGCFGCHEINGFDGPESIGPDLRLEPQTEAELAKYAADPNQIPGRQRKVGPSLRHVASKTTPEFIAYWTEMPSRFRPDTKMPQFFHLTNQEDELAEKYQPVQLAAIAAFLEAKSQPLELQQPQEGYQPSAERGKEAFSRRGCLACHSHDDPSFEGTSATFGPNLSKIHEKIKPGEEGFRWLYTWLRDPMRHHERTRMPNLFLEPEGEGENYIDPAADIAAFLLDGGPREFPAMAFDTEALDELVALFARETLSEAGYEQLLAERAYPRPIESIKGDEIELARRDGDPEQISDEVWRQRKIQYVGRRTISFYGCYGCHDIPEFESSRPIGTALQDWGRKDTSKLALEHIEEFLHHHSSNGHGVPLPEYLAEVVEGEANNPGQESEEDLSAAFFYESLQHHGRPGFIWQKLRQPRSYDYKKIETKGYHERLRMPKFPFNQHQIEAIATFVLGLVADPPPEQYLFRPDGPKADKIEGERVLAKYNCAGCHILELPEIKYATNPEDLTESTLGPGDFQEALDLLLQLKPPRQGLTGETLESGDQVVSFRGLVFAEPDLEEDPEFQEYSFDLWETLQVGKKLLYPGSKMLVLASKMIEQKAARGGNFAQWLVPQLMESTTKGNRALAWQASPPPLHDEGQKVQTPWLYRFLKDPHQIRYTTVLRMPRFNMSDAEAQALADYFAASDAVPYPYQSIPQQQPDYLDAVATAYEQEFPGAEDGYLEAAWKVVNVGGQQALCRKCHAVGGHPYQATDPAKDIRGPNLDLVSQRLRPDWLLLWIEHPSWITPYTSMPVNFTKNQKKLPDLFGGNGQKQSVAVRDVLLNYSDMMEAIGKIAYEPAGAPVDGQAASGGE